MARIYVSSTFSDLKECREQVRLALRRLGHEDVAMEYYGATDERPLDKCLNDVASSDLYIGIFALRYGYVPEGYNKSITEMEYRKAVETGKECLIFILAHDATWPVDRIEWNAHSRITEFRKELESSYIVSHLPEMNAQFTHMNNSIEHCLLKSMAILNFQSLTYPAVNFRLMTFM
jgi:hypothetical protein